MEVIDTQFCARHNLEFKSIIAQGGYGIVYLVYSTQYQQEFALKRILTKNFKQNEVDVMMKMHSPYICNLYQYEQYDQYVYMILEYCPHSLIEMVKKYKEMPIAMLSKYMYQILTAIEVCHEHNIAHSDIKPANILIDQYGRVKVCDFGLAKVVGNGGSRSCEGSLCFMAPELFKGKAYDPMKADVWALGVTFYYMATRIYPFSPKRTQEELITLITESIYDDSLITNLELRAIISKCLRVNPDERPTVSELLAMDFFTNNLPPTPLKQVGKSIVSSLCMSTRGSTTKLSKLTKNYTTTHSAREILCVPRAVKRLSHPVIMINRSSLKY